MTVQLVLKLSKLFQQYLFPRYDILGEKLYNYMLREAHSKASYLSTKSFKEQSEKLLSVTASLLASCRSSRVAFSDFRRRHGPGDSDQNVLQLGERLLVRDDDSGEPEGSVDVRLPHRHGALLRRPPDVLVHLQDPQQRGGKLLPREGRVVPPVHHEMVVHELLKTASAPSQVHSALFDHFVPNLRSRGAELSCRYKSHLFLHFITTNILTRKNSC